jgi:hypothetical protein
VEGIVEKNKESKITNLEKLSLMAETDLYLPIKRYLEWQGFTVKAEVKGCDVVAIRGDETPVIAVSGSGSFDGC